MGAEDLGSKNLARPAGLGDWRVPTHSPICHPSWVRGHWRRTAHILHTSEPIRATGQKHARAMQDEALGAASLREEWAQMPGLWGQLRGDGESRGLGFGGLESGFWWKRLGDGVPGSQGGQVS